MRKWISLAVAAALSLLPAVILAQTPDRPDLLGRAHRAISQDGPYVRIYSPEVKEPIRIFVISDTHLFLSDGREDPFREYSKRMAAAYNRTRDIYSREETTPEAEFRKTLALAKERGADAIALLGDIVSYPSEAGIELAVRLLDETGIPWFYTTGNHDWHYEGMEGTEIELREKWTQERLAPLYEGHDHLLYSVEVKGVKLIFLDNGVYEILPEQLAAFKREARGKQPKLLFSHIPFYAPGFRVSYGCGNPDWNEAHDRSFGIERRPKWPAKGHSAVTYAFWKAVGKACRQHRVLATFSGHIHKQSFSLVDGWPQFVTNANAEGGYYEVTLEPMP
jgi:3',5'-cyclic AMP phosphodiesterase CpdA